MTYFLTIRDSGRAYVRTLEIDGEALLVTDADREVEFAESGPVQNRRIYKVLADTIAAYESETDAVRPLIGAHFGTQA